MAADPRVGMEFASLRRKTMELAMDATAFAQVVRATDDEASASALERVGVALLDTSYLLEGISSVHDRVTR